MRDFAALNKIELLPWDCWGLADKSEKEITSDDLSLLDQVAALTLAGDEQFTQVRSLYEGDNRLRVPAVIRSYTDAGVQMVDLTTGG